MSTARPASSGCEETREDRAHHGHASPRRLQIHGQCISFIDMKWGFSVKILGPVKAKLER